MIFLHGHCQTQGSDNYAKWFFLPVQLARAGYVVVVPQLLDIAGGSAPWGSTDLQLTQDVVSWMQNDWLHHDYLMMVPPKIGVIGHSYGALLGARLVSQVGASTYVSLSGVWSDWPSNPPRPLPHLNVPSLFTWGSLDHPNETQAVLEGNNAFLWDEVPLPKHKIVFEDGDHWDYLPSNQISCGQLPGSCTLIKFLAGDFATIFLSKYMWPEESGILPRLIDDNLIPPAVQLTPEQQFFAAGHLTGLSLLNSGSGCRLTHTWINEAGSTGSTTF